MLVNGTSNHVGHAAYRISGGDAGSALVIVVSVLMILAVLAAAVPTVLSLEAARARQFADRMQAHYAARAGFESVLSMPPSAASRAEQRPKSSHQMTTSAAYEVTSYPVADVIASGLEQGTGEAGTTRSERWLDAAMLPVTAIADPDAVAIRSVGCVKRRGQACAIATIRAVVVMNGTQWKTIYWQENWTGRPAEPRQGMSAKTKQ